MSKAVYGVIPARYNVLEYIESNGTQYIDTGLKANQNTRIIMDYTLMSSGGDASLFGAWDGFSSKGFIYVVLSNMTSGWWCYANGTTSISMTATGRHIVEADGNVLTLDGTTIATASAADFTGSYNMYLFAHNEAGSAGNLATMRFHGCQIYDGDIMVRDYVPIPGPAGIGLYDRVTGAFFGNAGSGNFIAGPATGEVIEVPSTTRKGKKIYAVIDGLTRKVKKGYAVVSGKTRQFFGGSSMSVIYTGAHTVEDATLDGANYVLYTLTGSGTLTLDGAEDNVRYWMCGGGGNGFNPSAVTSPETGYTDLVGRGTSGGNGGFGGYVKSGTISAGTHTVVIAAAKGATSIDDASTEVVSNTAGGTGGGCGGNKSTSLRGAGVSTIPFESETFSPHCGGGGGGMGLYYTSSGTLRMWLGKNGSTNGGDGTKASSSGTTPTSSVTAGGEKGGGTGGNSYIQTKGGNATFYGSGGGGASGTASQTNSSTTTYGGGSGYQGVVYILVPA